MYKIIYVIALFVVAAPGSAQEVRLKLHHMLPPITPGHSVMLTSWVKKVETESDGRIAIDIYPSMHLGGQAPALIDQAREGIVDIVWTLPGYTPGRFPSVEVFELPSLASHPIAMNFAIQDFIDNHPQEFDRYKLISVFVHAGNVIHSSVPIRTTGELADLKYRIPGRVAGWMIESWGATPIGSTVQKIPEMLSKGIVDAALIPYEASFGLKVHDLVDYHIVMGIGSWPRFNTQTLMVAMNRDVYDGLPSDLKSIIDANSGRNIAKWLGEIWVEMERAGENAAIASGEVIYLKNSESELFRQNSQVQVSNRWISVVEAIGIDGRALLQEARDLIDYYSRQQIAGTLE
tara:strand:+ start:2683 stop:3723 length:1041 start_codon:yes stop_codon:yes gene_type:complete